MAIGWSSTSAGWLRFVARAGLLSASVFEGAATVSCFLAAPFLTEGPAFSGDSGSTVAAFFPRPRFGGASGSTSTTSAFFAFPLVALAGTSTGSSSFLAASRRAFLGGVGLVGSSTSGGVASTFLVAPRLEVFTAGTSTGGSSSAFLTLRRDVAFGRLSTTASGAFSTSCFLPRREVVGATSSTISTDESDFSASSLRLFLAVGFTGAAAAEKQKETK